MAKTDFPEPFKRWRFDKFFELYKKNILHRGKKIEFNVSCRDGYTMNEAMPILVKIWNERNKLFRLYRLAVEEQLPRVNKLLEELETGLPKLTKKRFGELTFPPSLIRLELEEDHQSICFTSFSKSFGDHVINGFVDLETYDILCETDPLY